MARYGSIGTYRPRAPAWGGRRDDEWQDIIGTMPSITEEQKTVSTPMSNYLSEALQGIGEKPSFADWSETNVPEMFGGALGSQAQGAYSEALSGMFPEDYFKKAIYDPAMTAWMEDIMPAIKESYVATGAIGGTEVGEKLGKEGRRLGEALTGTRATLAQQAKERSYGAAQAYQQSWQNQLALAYNDYIKSNPATADILQAALNYLNIPMMAAYQKPEPTTGGWFSSSRY